MSDDPQSVTPGQSAQTIAITAVVGAVAALGIFIDAIIKAATVISNFPSAGAIYITSVIIIGVAVIGYLYLSKIHRGDPAFDRRIPVIERGSRLLEILLALADPVLCLVGVHRDAEYAGHYLNKGQFLPVFKRMRCKRCGSEWWERVPRRRERTSDRQK